MRSLLPSKVAILGCTGSLGSILVSRLLQSEIDFVLGFGRRPLTLKSYADNLRFKYIRGDIYNIPLFKILESNKIECLIYLIFISRPVHNEEQAYRTNVKVAERALQAAGMAKVKQVVLLSSVAVYGPRSEANLATESDPLCPNPFHFSSHKVLQEEISLKRSVKDSMDLAIIRPCTVVGPTVNNFLLDIFRKPLVVLPKKENPSWQFLHEHDFCNAILSVMRNGSTGTYNLVPDDAVPIREAISLLGSRTIGLPLPLVRALFKLMWIGRIHKLMPAPPSALPFLRYPPLASNRLIRRELQINFSFSSRAAIGSVRYE